MAWLLMSVHLSALQATTLAPPPDVPVEHAMLFAAVPQRRYHLQVIEPDGTIVFELRQLHPVR